MRPQYSITEQPTSEPITLIQASDHLRVDSTEDQAYISALISVAREYFDAITSRSSAIATYLLTAGTWEDLFNPSRRQAIGRDLDIETVEYNGYVIPIYRTPLLSVDSIKYYAPESVEMTTMSASEYRVITGAEPGRIQLVNSPPAIDERIDAIQITFKAGSDCAPAMSKHAIKMLVANFYEQRTPIAFASANEIPYTPKTLIEQQKIGGNFR